MSCSAEAGTAPSRAAGTTNPPASSAGGASELVQLNVGGQHFLTTRTTLCAQGGMLAAMFGGEMQPSLLQDESGRYIIDRDGTFFSTMLNYLRDGQVVLPTLKSQLESVRAEAAFYNLPGLAAAADAALAEQAQPTKQQHALNELQSELSRIKEWVDLEMHLTCNERPYQSDLHASRIELLKLSARLAELRLQAAAASTGK